MSKNEDYKLFVIKDSGISNPSENLKLLIFPEDEEYFEDIDIFKEYVCVYYKKNLQPFILIHDINSGNNTRLELGDGVGELTPGLNKAFNTEKVKVEFSSPVNYKSIYEVDLKSKKSRIVQQAKIKGVNSKDFVVRETFAPGKDGESVPLTILHHKDMKLNRKNKTL